ncbi:MAG TPA: hypothetical protein VMV06_11345, partial [Acidimicrobiales bacterium]|nr:hypothetical protein [Acidimicrobiales bacterium]
MLRKANRRMAVGAALALVAASLVVLVPSAYAATITATPTSDSIATSATSGFTRQLVTSGNTNTVTFTQSTGAPQLTVSSAGIVSTSGPLAAGAYTATGNMTDLPGVDSGAYTYTLNVTAGAITQIAPTAASVTTTGSSAFPPTQLNVTGGVGTLAFAKLGGSANLAVSGTGVVTVVGAPLAAGPYSVNGTVTDSLSNTGTFAFTLTVTAVAGAITQVAPTSATVGTAGSASFTDQLNTTGNAGAVTFTKTGGSGV